MRRSTVERLLIVGMGLIAVGAAQGDYLDIDAQPPWEACGYCHNADGISASPRFPNLAGQQRDYLIAQLRAFRNGTRSNDGGVMQTMAQTLTQRSLAAVADHFSRLPLPVATAPADPPSAALYAGGDTQCAAPACSACHGGVGMGRGIVPRLAGQQQTYLRKQLADFADGNRKGVFDHGFARCLTASRRRALAAYLNGLSVRAGNGRSR